MISRIIYLLEAVALCRSDDNRGISNDIVNGKCTLDNVQNYQDFTARRRSVQQFPGRQVRTSTT